MGLIETAGKILEGIEAKAARGYEIEGERPKYLLLGALDYSLVAGAAALMLDGGDGSHAGEDITEVCGLTVIRANTLRLLEVGW